MGHLREALELNDNFSGAGPRGMILRLARCRVATADQDRLVRYVREQAIPEVLQIPGLLSFQPGTHPVDGGLDLVLVSTWTTYEALALFGGELDRAIAMPASAGIVQLGEADHFELVVGGSRGIPVCGATLGISRKLLGPYETSSYFEWARRWTEPLLDDSRLLAVNVGRRLDGANHEAVTVTLWAGDEALDDVLGVHATMWVDAGGTVQADQATARIERFDALTASHPNPEAPAVLLADDERRYFYATPAAARLTGHSIARLLTMRVDDLAAPRLRPHVPALWAEFLAGRAVNGPFALQRPDGSEVDVQFAAQARTPWPGSHVSLLVPGGVDGSLDVGRALAAAGLVPEYAGGT